MKLFFYANRIEEDEIGEVILMGEGVEVMGVSMV